MAVKKKGWRLKSFQRSHSSETEIKPIFFIKKSHYSRYQREKKIKLAIVWKKVNFSPYFLSF